MTSEVHLQCTLARPAAPTGTAQLAYVLIEARPAEAVARLELPLNLSLVLDHSGSMDGEKLAQLKAAVKNVLAQLQVQDTISLAVFEEYAQVLAPSAALDDPARLAPLVDGIQAVGGTAISRGLKLGLAEAKKAAAPTSVNRILLFTDGQTYGDEAICRELAAESGGLGIPITALGLGEDWNEELLDAIAAASGGQADFIRTPADILSHFQSVVRGMQATVVRQAELVLRLAAGVTPRQIWRVQPVITLLSPTILSERDVQLPLGELEQERGQAVLVELMVPDRPAGRYRIGQAEVRYDVLATGVTGALVRQDILLTYTDDPQLALQYVPEVMNVIEKVTAFKLQTRALEEASAGNLAGATQKLRATATRLLDLGETDLAAAAQDEAQRLEQGQGMSAGGTKRLRFETRKLVR